MGAGGQVLTSSATYLMTAVNGAASGTLTLRGARVPTQPRSRPRPSRSADRVSRWWVLRRLTRLAAALGRREGRADPCKGRGRGRTHTRKGSLGSEASTILKETLAALGGLHSAARHMQTHTAARPDAGEAVRGAGGRRARWAGSRGARVGGQEGAHIAKCVGGCVPLFS
jgi:hypothetical protein